MDVNTLAALWQAITSDNPPQPTPPTAVKVPPGVSLEQWEGLGPEVLSAPDTNWSFDNWDRGVLNIPNALKQISRDPSSANKYLVTPAAAGVALGAEGGPLSAGVGGLTGALMGLMSYGNPAANKVVQSATDVANLPGPSSIGMVSTGGKVLSQADHDALAADYYLEHLPKIAKQVKAKYFNTSVDDLVGEGAQQLMSLFRDSKVKDFANTKDLHDYLKATSRNAMEYSAQRGIGEIGEELTPAIEDTATHIPQTGMDEVRQSVEGALDKLLGQFLRPRDRVMFERTQSPIPFAGPNPLPNSSRSLAQELQTTRRDIRETLPQVKAQVQELGKQLQSTMQSKKINLEDAVNQFANEVQPNYSQLIKSYRKDLPKLHAPEKVEQALNTLPMESQGPLRDYMRGFSPAQLHRKWDGESTPDKLYQAFKTLESKL